MPVAPGTSIEPPVDVLDLPARDCLVTRVVGPYDRISEAHDLIAAHLTAEDLPVRDDASPAGRTFNLSVTTPDEVDEADLVTEVCVPLGGAG